MRLLGRSLQGVFLEGRTSYFDEKLTIFVIRDVMAAVFQSTDENIEKFTLI